MQTFPAEYFTYSTKYEEHTQVEMGRSYVWTEEEYAPDQRIFTLNLKGMQYFTDQNDNAIRALERGRNMWVLEDFYLLHRMSKSFIFMHPLYGQVICKFSRPLEVPEGIVGGNGILPDFEVQLLEIP